MRTRGRIAARIALVLACVVSIACGRDELAPVGSTRGPVSASQPAASSVPGVSVRITPRRVTRKTAERGPLDHIELDVVIANDSGTTIWYVDPRGGPGVDPTPPSGLILRFAVEALPENVNIGIFGRPTLATLAHGARATKTVRLRNPVAPRRWQEQWFDDAGLPVPRPAEVTLRAPLEVRAIVAVGHEAYDPVAAPGWDGFVRWQRLVASAPVILDP